jgi:hypothetical protein
MHQSTDWQGDRGHRHVNMAQPLAAQLFLWAHLDRNVMPQHTAPRMCVAIFMDF